MRSVPGWYRRRAEELEALFGPFKEAHGDSFDKDFIHNIGGLRDKLRQCFEQGKRDGDFPALSEFYDGLSSEDEDRFFATQGRIALPDIVLRSDEGNRLVRFKHELVLDLFLRRGKFWEEISDMRNRWEVKAIAHSPSSTQIIVRPEKAAGPEKARYEQELAELRERVIPARYSDAIAPWEFPGNPGNNWQRWEWFLSLCVMNDPPETDLVGFANYQNPRPTALPPVRSEWSEEQRATTERNYWPLRMVAPPIRWLEDPHTVFHRENWLHRTLIERVQERLAEEGLKINLVRLLEQERREQDLIKEFVETFPHSPKLYIEVNDWTTWNDVENAFRLIRQRNPDPQEGGAPGRDALVALQCALLYDRHNSTDPEDGRVKEWTYERLAKELGLRGPRAAKKHVELGRRILREN
jgi:hypothetical protein